VGESPHPPSPPTIRALNLGTGTVYGGAGGAVCSCILYVGASLLAENDLYRNKMFQTSVLLLLPLSPGYAIAREH